MMVGLATYGENPLAEMWLQQFRNVKLRNQLIPLFNSELVSGGSLEGTGYGTSHKELFTLYDWWQRSTGENIANLMPHTYNSLQWILHHLVPTLDYLAPVGDHARDSTAAFYDYHRHYILVVCSLYPTSPLARVAKTILSKSSIPMMTGGFNRYIDFMFDINNVEAAPTNDTNFITTSFRGDSTGIFATRSSWESDAVYAQVMCGPFSQSHAHRDQGSLLLYKKGWLAIDENFHTHSGIQQGESFHNMVRIESSTGTILQQKLNTVCNMSAISDNSYYSYSLSKVTPSYGGQSAIQKVEREFIFLKPSTVVVLDRVVTTTSSNSKRVWMINFSSAPTLSGNTITYNNGKSILKVHTLSPQSYSSAIIDWHSVESDANEGARVDLTDTTSNSNSTLFLNVFSIDNSVSSAVRDDSVAGTIGTTLSLSDGRKATLRFSKQGTGGSVTILSATNAVLVNEDLTTQKQALGVGAPVVPVASPKPLPSNVKPNPSKSAAQPSKSGKIAKSVNSAVSLQVRFVGLSMMVFLLVLMSM
ncbi:hypothetical protein C9374_009676 [Naegleria lovaniensis]|uniref:Uncharacterized protein n=1 Tax=Naegleria lovaniensis TaxID=51637 RepID=A0AA88KRY0_NAELO|nr:uncharacterized protein C9374_009676 [Naegleria lovaniensis]KAG2393099.1 hypothetical protein C9374_009676 [Naegleria lovaniensis]